MKKAIQYTFLNGCVFGLLALSNRVLASEGSMPGCPMSGMTTTAAAVSTNAVPDLDGSALSSAVKAARPPAEAPIATTGKGSCGGTNGVFDRAAVRGLTLPICVRDFRMDLRAVGAIAMAAKTSKVDVY